MTNTAKGANEANQHRSSTEKKAGDNYQSNNRSASSQHSNQSGHKLTQEDRSKGGKH